jgi:parallel beta-helix repeat protein
MKRSITSLFLYVATFTAVGCGGGDNNGAKDKAEAGADSGRDRGGELCTGDTACSDGRFCNGVERCDPSAKGADERGCVVASKGPCADGKSCEDGAKKCIACSEKADVDGDNHDAINCGGDDCDDNDANGYPGNVEVCDTGNHDEDCDPTTFGNDDSDGDDNIDVKCCNTGSYGKKYCGDDCDDTTVARHPGQLEICDEIDNDCDGKTDEEENAVNWYADSDGDGFGGKIVVKKSCQLVQGASLRSTDCDDSSAAIHPAAAEKCDARDNNCDGQTDEADQCTSCRASDDVKACLCAGHVLGFRACQSNGSWAECDCSDRPSGSSSKVGIGGAGGADAGAGGTGGAGVKTRADSAGGNGGAGVLGGSEDRDAGQNTKVNRHPGNCQPPDEMDDCGVCDADTNNDCGPFDYYVDANKGSDSNAGTRDLPFATITHAMTAAANHRYSIHVAPGLYRAASGEQLPINVPPYTRLIGDTGSLGRGVAHTTIEGLGTRANDDGEWSGAALVMGDGAYLAGFEFTSEDKPLTASVMTKNSSATITLCTFESGYAGIYTTGTPSPLIENNTFKNSAHGVYSYSGSPRVLYNDWPSATALSIEFNGRDGDTPVARGNTILGSEEVGIQTEGNGKPVLTSNRFSRASGYTYGCLRASGNSKVTYRNNECSAGTRLGIRIEAFATVDLGTAADPGKNVFTGTATIVSLENGNTIYAIGNTWPGGAAPVCGREIVMNASGTLVWGTNSGDKCP